VLALMETSTAARTPAPKEACAPNSVLPQLLRDAMAAARRAALASAESEHALILASRTEVKPAAIETSMEPETEADADAEAPGT
jgi:hypothetical protein